MRRPVPLPIARIVTPIQAEERSWQHLELGAAIAKELSAELRALLLRDADALAAAALPMTQTVSFHTGVLRPFNVQMLEAAYRAQAGRLRARVGEICRTQALHWSFEIDGHTEPPSTTLEGEAAAGEQVPSVHDLLLLDPGFISAPRLAADLLRLASRHVIIGIWHRVALKPQSVLLLSRGEAGAVAVSTAIADRLDIPLEVLVYGDTLDERAKRTELIRAQLQAQEHSAVPSLSVIDGRANLRDLVSRHRGALVLLDHLEALANS